MWGLWHPAAPFSLWLQNQIWCSCCEAPVQSAHPATVITVHGNPHPSHKTGLAEGKILNRTLKNHGLTIPLLVLFISGSILHRHLPLCYAASFAHTRSDPAWRFRWHHFLPLSWYLPPIRSAGKQNKQKHPFLNGGHCFHTCRCALFDHFRCGWMLVLRFSSPMQLVLDFSLLLEVTTRTKMTVTGKHSLLQTVPKVLPIPGFYWLIYSLIPLCLSGTVSTFVYWTAPPALWRASPFFLYWVLWPMSKEWIFPK